MAAALVTDLASRRHKKGVQKRRCLYYLCDFFLSSPMRALAIHVHLAFKPPDPHIASYVWGKREIAVGKELKVLRIKGVAMGEEL